MSDHNTSNLLTLNDVADALAVSNLTARRIVRRGEIASFQAGRAYRIRKEDLQAYIRQSMRGPKQRATRTAVPA
jgi:excisionase family DNA binding protein